MGEQEKFAKAVKDIDWEQMHLNGGEPCFLIERRFKFCGRAKEWEGHGHIHAFTSLQTAHAQSLARFRERCKEALREKASFGSPHRNPSDADKHWKQGVHAALKAIDSVPL